MTTVHFTNPLHTSPPHHIIRATCFMSLTLTHTHTAHFTTPIYQSRQTDIVEGRALFEEMVEEARIVPDAVTYTTLMELYGAAGQREQVGLYGCVDMCVS